MKTLLCLVLLFCGLIANSQTILTVKSADKVEYQLYSDYCLEGVSRTFELRVELSLLLVNGYYHKPITGAYTAKYPLITKIYPVDTKKTTVEPFQHEVILKFEALVPRRYPISPDDFYKYWKTGMIQSGYIDSKSCAIWP